MTRRTSLIIAAGFLLRAYAGQILFWISYLGLPIGRSLQLGNGLWFFALDGSYYLQYAHQLIEQGPKAILFADTVYPSHIFVQVFTVFCAVFGTVASTAILLNCAAYLATCALVLRIGQSDFTLAAIAFGPAMVLWSTQPLKDTLFFFLIVALVALAARWAERQSIGVAIGMFVVLYAIAGTRWYFAAIAWGLLLIFFALDRRGRLSYTILLFIALGLAFRLGGGDDIPRGIRDPFHSPVKNYVATTRRGFESTGGATAIKAGPAAPTKTAAGAVATFVPRTVAQEAKLVRIGGGRGFWLFADFDTVVFSAVIMIAIVLCVRAIRAGARITPLFVFVVLLLIVTCAPMIYTVTNFGTLFRLRQMLYLLAALAPVTLSRPAPEH